MGPKVYDSRDILKLDTCHKYQGTKLLFEPQDLFCPRNQIFLSGQDASGVQ